MMVSLFYIHVGSELIPDQVGAGELYLHLQGIRLEIAIPAVPR